MQLAKRHDVGIEILQAGAFALLVGFTYHYFGPSSTTPPSPEVFGILTVSVIMLVATLNQTAGQKIRPATAAETLTKAQAAQLSAKLAGAGWVQLEGIVTDVYEKLGCATSRRANNEGENNFSLVIDRAGHRTAVMCKPWKNTELTSPEIIEFSTELKQAGMSHGVLVTLREPTAPALSVAETLGIDIVNRDGLLHLLAACGDNYRAELLAMLSDPRKNCPTCDHEMVLRTATTGLGAGEQYWGCATFPQCRCTEPY